MLYSWLNNNLIHNSLWFCCLICLSLHYFREIQRRFLGVTDSCGSKWWSCIWRTLGLDATSWTCIGSTTAWAGEQEVLHFFVGIWQCVDFEPNVNHRSPCFLVLFQQGEVEKAERYFRKDMDKSFYGRCHPDNIWALCGLEQCLTKRPEAPPQTTLQRKRELVETRVKIALLKRNMDCEVTVACMCATKKICGCK